MIIIKTFQDLLALGENENDRKHFIITAINEHKNGEKYLYAKDAQAYYDGLNPTICKYEKLIYDFTGKATKDLYSANHKIASNFFGMELDQETNYLLSNGITFSKKDTKEKLGKGFDRKIIELYTGTGIAGISFGFWNLDHLEMFSLYDDADLPGFVPLYDENTGDLMAGIRYWQIDAEKPLNCVLYEVNGITEYYQDRETKELIQRAKYGYKQSVKKYETTGEIIDVSEVQGYDRLPIFPMKYNRKTNSALVGKKNTLDALDLVTSGMVNNVDEGNLIYWVLENCQGMDIKDDVAFLKAMRTTHVVHADGDDGSARATPHTIEAPFVGTENAINTLTKRLFTDFQAFDSSAVSAGNQTATAIKASYIPLDLKCDKAEAQVSDFIERLLNFLGIDDEPTYNRNQIINRTEESQNILIGAEYFDDEYITKKLLAINGDIDQYDDLMSRKIAEDVSRFPVIKEQTEPIKEGEDDENNAD